MDARLGGTRKAAGAIALLVAVVAVLGLQTQAVHASHFANSTLTCAPTPPPAAVACTLTVGPLTHPLPPGDTLLITLHAGLLTAVPRQTGGACPVTSALSPSASAFLLTTAAACDSGTTIVLSETVLITDHTALCQTITDSDVSNTEPATICPSVGPRPLIPFVPGAAPFTPAPALALVLEPGCTAVSAPAGESAEQFAARVEPPSAVISIWRQAPGSTDFTGISVLRALPYGIATLGAVAALDTISVCVRTSATLRLT